MGEKKIFLGNIDRELLETIAEDIRYYVTAIVVLRRENGGLKGVLLGSGTFIQVGEKFGILTAYHVVHSRSFERSEQIGLVIAGRHTHNFWIPRKHTEIIDIGRPQTQQSGPDMSVLLLEPSAVGTIKASKSFWVLEKHADTALSQSHPAEYGCYCLSGCPAELVKDDDPAPGFGQTLGIAGVLGFSGVDKAWEESGFDYLEFGVSYDDKSDSPDSFEGVSGAGLWYILLKNEANAPIVHERPVLCGIAYYQTARDNNIRSIYCHGPKSIYENVRQALFA